MKSLKKDLNLLMKSKSCDCNPCSCSEQEKKEYYQNLKEILKKYNRDYTQHHYVIRENFAQSFASSSIKH